MWGPTKEFLFLIIYARFGANIIMALEPSLEPNT
jgi:hypothetical protein